MSLIMVCTQVRPLVMILLIVKQSKLQDLSDIWNNPNISYPEGTAILKKAGR